MTFFILFSNVSALYLKNCAMINVSKLTFNLTSKGIGASGIWNIYANKFVIKHKYKNFYSKISAVKYSKMTTCCPSAKYEPTALVMLPTGAEELEFVAVVDVLRRGKVSIYFTNNNA